MQTDSPFRNSEVVIGLVAPVGTDLVSVVADLKSELSLYRYRTEEVKITNDVFRRFGHDEKYPNEYERVDKYIAFGDEVCSKHGNATLAQGAASEIGRKRAQLVEERIGKDARPEEFERAVEKEVRERFAYVVNQLKRTEEVDTLRSIYGEGFYLLGVYTDDADCVRQLVARGMTEAQAYELKKKDAGEESSYGQKTRETFELADFFIHDSNPNARRNSIVRMLEILFGHPYKTPTFDEYAMFTAFTSGLRSADLSRQVGAVIARDEEILAMGSNECPRAGGGVYWPIVNSETWEVYDSEKGRDYMRGEDSNVVEKNRIVDSVVENIVDNDGYKKLTVEQTQAISVAIQNTKLGDLTKYDQIADSVIANIVDSDSFNKLTEEQTEAIRVAVQKSKLRDITEYGRVVHAEMDALLSCARNGISCREATIYCTTFPCHNCAKHLIAAGIKRVVYVEPYPKSKAPQFHDEAICMGVRKSRSRGDLVHFQPFIGVGPRRFISLFSLRWGMGYPVTRKTKDGKRIEWEKENASLRLQMQPSFYIKREIVAMNEFISTLESLQPCEPNKTQ